MDIQKLVRGYACIVPQNIDDLWVLSEILKAGDLVGKRTARKIKLNFGDRTEVEKKSMYLRVSVEETSFHEYTSSLRISGQITEGPDDVSGSHTFTVEPGTRLEVWKDFDPLELGLLKESRKEKPEVAFVLIDRQRAFISHGRSQTWISNDSASKRSEGDFSQFFGDIKARLNQIDPQYVVVAGPGFVKDKLASELQYKTIVEGASSVGESGLREVLSRGVMERVDATVREAEEHKVVEHVFRQIPQGLAFYGMEDAVRLAEQGNVESLVVSSALISGSVRDGKYPRLRKIIEKVKYQGGQVMLVGRDEDALSRLEGLGGVAGIRRWKQ